MQKKIPFEATSLSDLYKHGITSVSAAIGVFDGIHLGHRAIISKLLEVSSENSTTPIVITFAPHPRQILGTESNIHFLRSGEDKTKILGELGMEAVVTINFTKEISMMSPEDFIDKLLGSSLCNLKAVCVGRRWRFGHGASGTVHVLMDISKKRGFQVFPVNEVHIDCGRVSSSAIRQAIANNNLTLAREMLSDPSYTPYGSP